MTANPLPINCDLALLQTEANSCLKVVIRTTAPSRAEFVICHINDSLECRLTVAMDSAHEPFLRRHNVEIGTDQPIVGQRSK